MIELCCLVTLEPPFLFHFHYIENNDQNFLQKHPFYVPWKKSATGLEQHEGEKWQIFHFWVNDAFKKKQGMKGTFTRCCNVFSQ